MKSIKSSLIKTSSLIAALATLLSPLEAYVATNLVSNQVSEAPNLDERLINPWGLTFDADNHLFVADNGTNLSTSYRPSGSLRNFNINVPGSPTGIEYNRHKHTFKIGSHTSELLFATESGTILGYNKKANAHNAIVLLDNSAASADYKGIAIATIGHDTFLYVTDFFNAIVDMYDRHLNLVTSFTDPTLPEGYAPFNIRHLNGKLYVTFALQDECHHDEIDGPGNGYVSVFNTNGTYVTTLISQGFLNAPWGLAKAPKNFGQFSNALLVGNFGDGMINAYDISNGTFLGHISDASNVPLVIDGLWGIRFIKQHHRNQTPARLYFTAGPDGETNGLLGVITP